MGLQPIASSYIRLVQKVLINSFYGDPAVSPWNAGTYSEHSRKLGLDWPSQAMTMIGEKRLSNILFCMDSVICNRIPGDFIETGVWRGGACIFMRAILLAYGVVDRRVWVADSFRGLPQPDPKYSADEGDQHHLHDVLAVSREDVERNFRLFDLLDDQVVFIEGWFEQTLPRAPIDRLAVLRLDGDMYSSTMQALLSLYDKVSTGGYVIVDDYGTTPNCRAAIHDFREERGISSEIVDIDGSGSFWKVVQEE